MATHDMYLRKLLEVIVFLQHYTEVQYLPFFMYMHVRLRISYPRQDSVYLNKLCKCKLSNKWQ